MWIVNIGYKNIKSVFVVFFKLIEYFFEEVDCCLN